MARRGTALGAVGCLVLLIMVGLIIIGLVAVLRPHDQLATTSGAPRCVATADGNSVVVDLEQARLTAIIVGLSVRRDLPPRAGSIAMATVYQESGIRNLDYGDRDSVGLFQQRPSQDWGTEKQIMDPYYATGRFYDALIKVKNWQTGDINDVAQAVQRSGYPEAYRDHERDGRILASVFSGRSPGGLSCQFASPRSADPAGLQTSVQKTLGVTRAKSSGETLTISTTSAAQAWAVAHHAQANAHRFGVASVQVTDQTWRYREGELADWQPSDSIGQRLVIVRFR